jgi:hypothetical protein
MTCGELGRRKGRMKAWQIPINNVDEDTEVVFVNSTTLKIQGVYYSLSGEFKTTNDTGIYDFTNVRKLSDGYIQSITWDGTNYSVSVLRKYTKNNADWCDLGYIDVSGRYTNEVIINPTLIDSNK